MKNGGWCIVTTPKRRHKGEVHFASEICKIAAKELGINFYEDALTCRNRHRIEPEFELELFPKERNVILYDDIITTGSTMNEARRLLTKSGYLVFSVIAIRNQ